MNYFAKPYTKPTTGTAKKRKPKIRIFWSGGLKNENGVKRLRDGKTTLTDSRGKAYTVEVNGQITRMSPKRF